MSNSTSLKRSKYDGDILELFRTIEPYATSARWLQYDDNIGSKLSVARIKPHKKMMKELYALQNNWAFTKYQMENVMQALVDKNETKHMYASGSR